MKKIILLLAAFLFLIPSAYANSIDKISMDIFIDEKGDARVKEIWDVYASGEGTEIYKTYNNVGNSKFENFKVTLDGREFTPTSYWNTSGSFSSKSYKNGINYISDGLELCWGISKTGSNRYVLEYTITNFVLELSDSQMVYWTLIPRNLSSSPEEIDIKIHSDFYYQDTLDVWGYGKYGALAYVADGYIHLYSENGIDTDEYITVLAKFPQNSFNTNNKDLNNDFNYYLDMANDGAKEYKENSLLNMIIPIMTTLIFTVFPTLLVFIFIISAMKSAGYMKTTKKLEKDIPYFREIPCNKDIFRAYYISELYSINQKETDFLGSVLLKWLKENKIKIEEKEKKTLFGKISKVSSITFINDTFDNGIEKELYDMMLSASKDGILEEDEFERWCNNNYQKIFNWFKAAKKYEMNNMITTNEIIKEEKKVLKIIPSLKYTEQETIYEDAKKLCGLKKYLKDFTLINQKEVKEVYLWEEYLMFAQMFGIAKTVIKQFKDIYPEYINNLGYDFDTIILINNFSTRSISKAESARSKAQSYSSGGGGFSSGGGGGGSFGGGSGGGGFR